MPDSPISADLELAEAIGSCYADPLRFVQIAYPWGDPLAGMAGITGPYQWQAEYLRALGEEVKRRRFNGSDPVSAIRMSRATGHGVGKSVMCAWLVAWTLSTRPHSKGTVTANTYSQLETKTWSTIRTWMARCINRHWFDVGAKYVRHVKYPQSWFCSAQTCAEENSEAFAGQHAADSTSFYIFDEASAIPDRIWEVAEGGLVKGEPMIFAFGNPTRSQGQFFRINFGRERSRWNHGSLDSRTAGAVNAEQIKAWLDQYGEESDFFRVRVRGLPPRASDISFIGAGDVQAAFARDHQVLDDEPLVAGFDAANGGLAMNVCAFRRGLDGKSVPAPLRWPGDTPRDVIVGKLAEVMAERNPSRRVAALFVDSAFGAAIAVRLQGLGFTNVFEVNFGAPSPDPHQANMRAFMWQKLKDWLQLGALRESEEMEMQLTSPGFHINQSGKLVLESKADMAKRGVASPDDADALCLTFARPVAGTWNVPGLRAAQRLQAYTPRGASSAWS